MFLNILWNVTAEYKSIIKEFNNFNCCTCEIKKISLFLVGIFRPFSKYKEKGEKIRRIIFGFPLI